MKQKKIMSPLMLILLIVTAAFTSCKSGGNKSDSMKDMKMDEKDSTGMMAGMKMMKSMDNMMKQMNSMQMTRDFDYDFATMMIMHHQGAIDMAQEEIASGKDEKIKAMARQIIIDQKEEQGKLKTFLNSTSTVDQKSAGNEDALMKAMEPMEHGMKQMQMSNDADKDFVMMMIPHHESAVEMAKSEIANGHHDEIKQMAQQMITAQTNEIQEFKKWLSDHK